MTLPIGPKDVRMDLGEGRDPGLPDIYKTAFHPKKTSPGNIYYYVESLTKPHLLKAMELEERLRIPQGPERVAVEQGEPMFNHIFIYVFMYLTIE
jgi:hypothetical protein